MSRSTLQRSAATFGVIAGLLASTGSAAAAAVVTDNKDPERKPSGTVTCLDQDLNSLKPATQASLGRENTIECLPYVPVR